MSFEFTKSIISFFGEWNDLNIFIVILSITNFSIITYKSTQNKKSINNLSKLKNIEHLISLLAILTIAFLFSNFLNLTKCVFLIIMLYYFYCLYIVPIFDIKDDSHIFDISEQSLILMSGFYYYFSIQFSVISNSNIASINASSAQIIYIILMLILSFTFTYCIFLNIFYILRFWISQIIRKLSNINFKDGKDTYLNLDNKKNTISKLFQILYCYLMYVVGYLLSIFLTIPIFIVQLVGKLKDVSIKKSLSIIAKLSIVFSLIIVYIIIKFDSGYNEIVVSLYETLISVIIIPLVLEGLLSIKKSQ